MTLVDALVAEQISGPKSGTLIIREEATDICARIDSSSKLQQTIQALVTRVNYLIAETTLVPQSGLDPVMATELQETVAFTAGGGVNEFDAQKVDYNLETNITESTLKGFLARPSLVWYGTIDASDTACWFGPDELWSSYLTTNSVVQGKLVGIYGIKYTMVVKLILNGEKFQQGRQIMGFVPTGGYVQTKSTNWFKHHAGTLEGALQCPHVEIDISTETEAVLRIPWNQVSMMASVQDALEHPSGPNTGSPGLLFLRTYMPFRTGPSGSATATYSIFIHLEDVEFYGLAPQSGLTKVRRDIFQGMATEDGDDAADALAISSTPSISSLSSDSSILNICSTKATCADQTVWNTSHTINTTIMNRSISLSNFVKVYTDTTGNTFLAMTPLGMMGFLFNQWRGDLRAVLKISKTPFHSGRLQVAFNPTCKGASGTVLTTGTAGYLINRVIWDVRENVSIEFVIPYTYMSAWCTTAVPIGNLSIVVLNPLRCPETVSTSVDIALELYAGPSFEVAVPTRHYLCPHLPLTSQSGLEVICVNANTHKSIDLGYKIKRSQNATAHCVGEKVTDLLQLCRRYGAYDLISSTIYALDQIQYQPFQLNCSYWNGSTKVVVTTPRSVTDAISMAFTASRGSILYRIVAHTTTLDVSSSNTHMAPSIYVQLLPVSNLNPGFSVGAKGVDMGSESESDYLNNGCGSALSYSRVDINGGNEIRVPHYHYDPYRAHVCCFIDTNNLSASVLGGVQLLMELNINNVYDTLHMFRKVGPDFELSNFISFGSYLIVY